MWSRLNSARLWNRLLKSHDYDACIMGLVDGDADPTPELCSGFPVVKATCGIRKRASPQPLGNPS